QAGRGIAQVWPLRLVGMAADAETDGVDGLGLFVPETSSNSALWAVLEGVPALPTRKNPLRGPPLNRQRSILKLCRPLPRLACTCATSPVFPNANRSVDHTSRREVLRCTQVLPLNTARRTFSKSCSL